MRIAYLDDSGLSSIVSDPNCIIAGIVVEPDKHLKRIENRLEEIRHAHVHEPSESVIFHAVDIFHGSGDFDRQAYSDTERGVILSKVAAIPAEFDLPVAIGCVDRREQMALHPGHPVEIYLPQALKLASTRCASDIEAYMRANTTDEICLLIYENNKGYQQAIREQHTHLRNKNNHPSDPFFPFERISEAALFAEKSECALFQVADSIAFVVNRICRADRSKDKIDCEPIFRSFQKQIAVRNLELLANTVGKDNIIDL